MYKKPTIEDVLASAKEAPKRTVRTGDNFKNNPDVVYKDISDKDWDDKQQVTVKTIVQVFKNAFELQDLDTIEAIKNHISSLNEQRIHEVDNAFGKANFDLFEKKLWETHSAEIFDTPELHKYLKDGDVQLFVFQKYIEIYYEAINRALPLDDTNASRQQENFNSAKNIMMNLLLRSNKKKDAQILFEMSLDQQPDTLESYLMMQMDNLRDELSESVFSLNQNAIDQIAINLKKEIKAHYGKKFKELQAMLISFDNEKKPTNNFNESKYSRRVPLLMKLDLHIKLLPLKNQKRSSGLGLSDKAIKHFKKKIDD